MKSFIFFVSTVAKLEEVIKLEDIDVSLDVDIVLPDTDQFDDWWEKEVYVEFLKESKVVKFVKNINDTIDSFFDTLKENKAALFFATLSMVLAYFLFINPNQSTNNIDSEVLSESTYSASISKIDGSDVKVKRTAKEEWKEVLKEDKILQGDNLKTEGSSQVRLELEDKNLLALPENSEIEIISLKEGNAKAKQINGGIFVQLLSKGSGFELEADEATISAYNEAAFVFDFKESGVGEVKVLEGEVIARIGKDSIKVSRDEVIKIDFENLSLSKTRFPEVFYDQPFMIWIEYERYLTDTEDEDDTSIDLLITSPHDEQEFNSNIIEIRGKVRAVNDIDRLVVNGEVHKAGKSIYDNFNSTTGMFNVEYELKKGINAVKIEVFDDEDNSDDYTMSLYFAIEETPTPTEVVTPTITESSKNVTPTVTSTPIETPTVTPRATSKKSPTKTPKPTATNTPAPTVTPTNTPVPSPTSTPTPISIPTNTPTPTPVVI